MGVAVLIFFASLLGLAGLFTLKAIEAKRGAVYAPRLRASADKAALSLKRRLFDVRFFVARIPPAFLALSRFALRELALAAARFARGAEKRFYAIADFVSHKRNFERRESRSEFLKQVSEHKNGLPGQEEGSGQDGRKEI